MNCRLVASSVLVLCCAAAFEAQAGRVFITGHDPDFHAFEGSLDAKRLLETGLNYVTNGTYDTPGHKFLWVESNNPVLGGHVFGENSLTATLGLVQGVNFDHVDAAGLVGLDLSQYSAIAIASSFGGMLTQAEISELIVRKGDIAAFVNAGGGLFASSECGFGFSNCDPSNIGSNASLFGFLPVTATSVSQSPPFSITPFGTQIGAPFGLTSADLQDPTHNSFAPVAGLTPVDLDALDNPTTLAGEVGIGGNGFTPPPSTDAPEPATLGLMGGALAGLAWLRRRRRA